MKLSVELFRPEIICVVHELSTALQPQPHIYTHTASQKKGGLKARHPLRLSVFQCVCDGKFQGLSFLWAKGKGNYAKTRFAKARCDMKRVK